MPDAPYPDEPAEAAEDVRYDLAGNPLPPLPASALPAAPRPAAATPAPAWGSPAQVPGGAPPGFTAPPLSTPPPGFTPPPGSVPRPGGFTPPPGYQPPGARPAPAHAAPTGPALWIGLGVAALVVLGLIFGVAALKPVTVDAPKSYTTYTAIDNTFSCDQPGGWKLKESGVQGGAESQAMFKLGHAQVHIVSDAVGSLMADATSSSLIPQKPAVQRLHEADEHQLADELPGYDEGDAQPFQSKVGDSRLSEWTADGGGGGKLHGYRVTMLDKDREITVICLSPQRNWAVLQPAFQRIISSVVPGNG